MFRKLIYPPSGACDYSVELPHWSYCSWFDVCCCFGVVGLEWYLCCSRLKPAVLLKIEILTLYLITPEAECSLHVYACYGVSHLSVCDLKPLVKSDPVTGPVWPRGWEQV